jgi:hypothetical protein
MQLVDLDTTRELPIKKPLSAYVHFLNEVRLLSSINQPNLLPLFITLTLIF